MVTSLTQGPASLGQMAKPLAMSLPAVQQHLRVLEQAGLVTSRKVGRQRVCELDSNGVMLAERWLHERRLHWKVRLDQLESHLAKGDNR